MHHFHSHREIVRIWICSALVLVFGGLVAISMLLMLCGLLMSHRGLLVISLVVLACALVSGLVHWLLARSIRCPLCRGAVLASQGCSRHRRTFRLLGSSRLGVALPVLLFLRFRCPYCGELCSCRPKSNNPRSSRRGRTIYPAATLVVLLCMAATGLSPAMTVNDYSSAANDRFSSGYPSAPVENTDPAFVGLGLDGGGVGWASTAATKSFGFLSPRHYLVARHFGGAANIRIFADGTLQTYAQQSVEDIGLGVVFQNETLGDI
jgi:hypothetical protein